MEDKKDLLKKYWFVGLIAIALIVFIGVYIVDDTKNGSKYVSSKQVDGQYVVYSVDGKDVFANDFFDSIYEKTGISAAFIQFKNAVANKAIETSEDMTTIATNYAAYILQQYGQDTVVSDLRSMGYPNGIDDLVQYYVDMQKQDKLVMDYVGNNWDKYYTDEFVEEESPRVVSHILIKIADITESTENGTTTYTANPTEEESKKLNDVLEALKTKDFAEVAKEYSDDTSGENGGLIGCICNSNAANYVPEFSNAALALKDQEVSDVITSQYGYHIIMNLGSTKELLATDASLMSVLTEKNININLEAVMDKAAELNFEVVDQELLDAINSQLGSEDAQ